jgi:shikimate kinase
MVLVGPPGSGKTTVGRALAQRIGVTFVDSDERVEQQQGRTIADIFVDDGEAAFRELERATCHELITTHDGVVSLGGGSVLDPRTEADLAGVTVVFLDVAIADAARRIGFGQSRPLLSVNPRAAWTQLMNGRRAVYERVATHTVDTAGREVDDVVQSVIDVLPESLRTNGLQP